ncbi:uncharacterized protein LOC117639633 isoform X2 [Thrips palmi]|uniref:Uncharacterized protein LOC117639633 isoform X2 n=1 Tax=Thrips palmi TaxID=161013 RepID=A0A6P8ZH78_THRPL|nr:uncharacterized protein LOC117639633 isoform X2 [Thrips palmi]
MPADGLSALLDVAQQALVRVAADEGFNDPQFEVESGSGARDGFTSTLSRIIVREKDGSKELSLICKTSLDAFGGLMSWLFTTECYMYSTVLPALEDVATLEEPLPWPKCYHAFSDGDKPPYCMVLGDLRPDGFATCPRRDALDAAQCKQVLRQIGRFHGAGLALKHLRPEAFQSMRQWRHIAGNTYDTPEMRTLMAPFQAAIAKCKISEQLAERFPSGDTLAALDKIFSMYAEDLLSVMCPGAEEGSTIIHSDCHTMNVLFQYSGTSR